MHDDIASEKRRMYTNYNAVLAELKHKGQADDYADVAETLKKIEQHLFRKYPAPRIEVPQPPAGRLPNDLH